MKNDVFPERTIDECGAEKKPLHPTVHRDSRAAAPGNLRLIVARHGDDWRDGDAITPDGLVSIYDQGQMSGSSPQTHMDVVAGGRLHTATWDRTFSDRFLLTLAKRFAALVAREHLSPRQVEGDKSRDELK